MGVHQIEIVWLKFYMSINNFDASAEMFFCQNILKYFIHWKTCEKERWEKTFPIIKMINHVYKWRREGEK